MVRVDLHVHTHHSSDAVTTPDEVVRWAARRGLGAVAVTDHDTIAGALAVRERAPFPVIVGSEIRTNRGEIIGLFLEREIPPGLSPRETIRRIHDQGGLACVPHAMDRLRSSTLHFGALLEVIEEIDLLEALNARVTWPQHNRKARRLAAAYGIPIGAGSDAHQAYEIGRAAIEMPPFSAAAEFLAALPLGRIVGRVSSPLVHVTSTCARLARSLGAAAAPPH